MSIDARLEDLGIEIPEPPSPVANFRPFVKVGDMLYISGQGPFLDGEQVYKGKLGRDISIKEGYDAARITILNSLGVIKNEYGSLNNVKKIVKLLGIVNSTDDFYDQPKVVNGASDLLVEIFGDAGKHARSAIGVNTLYADIPVEIEVIVQLNK